MSYRLTAKQKAESRAESLEYLRKILKPGDTIRSVVRSVSRSGMSRTIDFYLARNGDLVYLTGHMAAVLDEPRNDQGAMKVTGCGMDMCFATVYNLGYCLWPDGFECAGRDPESRGRGHGCPSNDHSNGDRDYAPHHHRDGGYALHSERI